MDKTLEQQAQEILDNYQKHCEAKAKMRAEGISIHPRELPLLDYPKVIQDEILRLEKVQKIKQEIQELEEFLKELNPNLSCGTPRLQAWSRIEELEEMLRQMQHTSPADMGGQSRMSCVTPLVVESLHEDALSKMRHETLQQCQMITPTISRVSTPSAKSDQCSLLIKNTFGIGLSKEKLIEVENYLRSFVSTGWSKLAIDEQDRIVQAIRHKYPWVMHNEIARLIKALDRNEFFR